MDAPEKLMQLTDNIHETIYLSNMESALISTPFCHRLHDVYQSSTVYMAFPSNRTKRFEHSMGTMQLASDILFHAITNADPKIIKGFLQDIKEQFYNVVQGLVRCPTNKFYQKINEGNFLRAITYEATEDRVREGMEMRKHVDDLLKRYKIEKSSLYDHALCKLIPNTLNSNQDKLLYLCVVQALRVSAMFHDIGHPPYSHIIEKTFSEIRETQNEAAQDSWNERQKKLAASLGSVFNAQPELDRKDNDRILNRTDDIPVNLDMQAHEIIGLRMLNNAFEEASPRIFYEGSQYAIENLFATIVYEFVFAILMEKSDMWKTLHKIIDGPLDADRLDYIVRDTRNSGVDWGTIPYKRIIDVAKLVTTDKAGYPFAVAFPDKLMNDIDDVFVMRYKVYARINYHHRVAKRACLLKESVMEISKAYLNASTAVKSDQWYSGIDRLWTVLDSSNWGQRGLEVSRWNDSWLIAVLNFALLKLSHLDGGVEAASTESKTKACLDNLLLNQKRYYSVFKRGNNFNGFLGRVMEKAEMTTARISRDIDTVKEGDGDVSTTVKTLQAIRQSINEGDYFNILNEQLAGTGAFSYIIRKEIEEASPDVIECLYYQGLEKNGLERLSPKTPEAEPAEYIFFYQNDDNHATLTYDAPKRVGVMLDAMKKNNVPWYYFVRFKDGVNTVKTMETVYEKLETKLAENLCKAYQEKFQLS